MTAAPTVGSVLNLTSAAGTVEFTSCGEVWALPLIAWAVVVTWTSTEDDHTARPVEYETTVEPVILDDETGQPDAISCYLAGRSATVTWRCEQ